MIVIKAYKYRIYPTKEQEIQLSKTFGSCRFVYNQMLAKKIELYKNDKISWSKFDCVNYCTRVLKKEYPWLKEVDKFSLANSIWNLDSAYKNFFREIKKGNKNQGFPKFKSKKNHYYSYKTNFTNNNIKVDFENNKIQLPKLKKIEAKLHRKFNGKIFNATISKTPSGKYYVSIDAEVEQENLPKINKAIGLDLGIKDLLITSNGEVFNNKKLADKYEKKLAKLQRQQAKMINGSNNFKKQSKKIARLHERVTNIRKDNLHKISSQIIKDNQLIFSEDLNIKDMAKNHNYSKKIYDMGWYELTRELTYKSEWYGRTYKKVDRYYPSSQLCSICGYKNDEIKNLKIRFWECPKCHTEHDRDKNASINILNEGLKKLTV